MPFDLPAEFGNATWEPKDQFTLVDEGIYPATIFNVEKKVGDKGPFYAITFRIDGGNFDGEDVTLNYAGLTLKTIFRTYDILKAIGTVGTFYNAESKTWKALPAPEDLETKRLYIRVEHEKFHAKKEGQPQYNDDGSPRILDGARPTGFYSLDEAEPTFKPTKKREPVAAAGGNVQGQTMFPGAVAAPGQAQQNAGGTPFNGETPW